MIGIIVIAYWISTHTRWILHFPVLMTLLLVIPVTAILSLCYAVFLSHTKQVICVTYRHIIVAFSYCFIFWLCAYLTYQNKALLLGIDFFHIQSESMMPVLLPGDIVLADTKAYRTTHPIQGDIVFFQKNDESNKVYVKRVSKFDDKEGVYLLGDNTQYSTDSRTFGFIPVTNIIAHASSIVISQDYSGNIRKNRIGIRLAN